MLLHGHGDTFSSSQNTSVRTRALRADPQYFKTQQTRDIARIEKVPTRWPINPSCLFLFLLCVRRNDRPLSQLEEQQPHTIFPSRSLSPAQKQQLRRREESEHKRSFRWRGGRERTAIEAGSYRHGCSPDSWRDTSPSFLLSLFSLPDCSKRPKSRRRSMWQFPRLI